MRLWLSIGAGLLLVGPRLAGQITVTVSFDEDQYLAHQAMVAAVKIVNFSGQTLKLGEDQDWLRFAVESDDYYVTKRGDPPVIEPFELPSASKATRRVDLAPYFDLSKPGYFRVTATVRIAQLGLEITSPPARVGIINGTKLWDLEFGVPAAPGDEGAPPEVRKYALLQTMSQKRMRLFVRVSDRFEARVFRVFPLGPLLGFTRPEAQVDRQGQLHVLFQTGAREFTYCVVSPDGELLKRQTYHYTDSRPRLHAGQNAELRVLGGRRAVTATDLPKPSDAELANPNPPLPPPSPDKAAEGNKD